jgi:hypothetical protein
MCGIGILSRIAGRSGNADPLWAISQRIALMVLKPSGKFSGLYYPRFCCVVSVAFVYWSLSCRADDWSDASLAAMPREAA